MSVSVRKFVFAVLGFWMFIVVPPMITAMLTDWAVPGRILSYAMFGVMLVGVAGWIAYLWDVFHNSRVAVDKRALWAVVLVVVGPFAMPFYFWFYIRGDDLPPLPPPWPGPPPLP